MKSIIVRVIDIAIRNIYAAKRYWDEGEVVSSNIFVCSLYIYSQKNLIGQALLNDMAGSLIVSLVQAYILGRRREEGYIWCKHRGDRLQYIYWLSKDTTTLSKDIFSTRHWQVQNITKMGNVAIAFVESTISFSDYVAIKRQKRIEHKRIRQLIPRYLARLNNSDVSITTLNLNRLGVDIQVSTCLYPSTVWICVFKNEVLVLWTEFAFYLLFLLMY